MKLPPFSTMTNCVSTVKKMTPKNMGFFNPFTTFQLLVMDRELNSLNICQEMISKKKQKQDNWSFVRSFEKKNEWSPNRFRRT